MNETVDLQLRSSWMPTLGEAMGTLTVLSPFRFGSAEGDPRGELLTAGLLDAEGHVQERFRDIMQLLATPKRLSRLRYSSPELSLEYQAFFDGVDQPGVALFSTETGYVLRFPADFEGPLGLVADVSGISDTAALGLGFQLPSQEARVAMALADASRQHFAVRLVVESEMTIPVVTSMDIVERLEEGVGHPNRLETAYRQLELPHSPMDEDAVGAALSSLEGRGLASAEEGGFVAQGMLRDLCLGLLLVSGWYEMDTVSEDSSGGISAGRGVIVAGGPRALLLMEQDDGLITFSGLSAQTFLQILGPLFMEDPPEDVAATASASAVGFCGKCGSALSADTKFCGKCGNPNP
jgi:hypothetical protein